jgi:predicted DNA-binding transcriptional regulator YafY
MLGQRITVRLGPDGRRLLRYAVEPYAARRALADAGEPDADGWVTTRLPIEFPEIACHELLRLGTQVEVLDPPELREMIAGTAARIAGLYR